MDNKMQTLKSIKTKPPFPKFNLSLLKPKKNRKPVKHNVTDNISTKDFKKVLDIPGRNIDNRKLSTSSDGNYRNKFYVDSHPELNIENQKNGEQKTVTAKDTSKNGSRIENELENFSNIDKVASIKEITNKTESNIVNTVVDKSPKIFKLNDQIKNNDNQLETNDSMDVLQKSMKRRRIELKKSKLNYPKKLKTDNENPQIDPIISKQQIEGRRKPKSDYVIKSDPSKFSQSLVEQSKMNEKITFDSKRTKTPNKDVKKQLNNSESVVYVTRMNNGLETSINEIDQNKEINSISLQSESDTVTDNGPKLSKFQESKKSKSCSDLKITRKSLLNHEIELIEDRKQPSLLGSITQPIGLSKFNENNEKSEINVKQSKTPNKMDSHMHNGLEIYADELKNTKPRTDTKITNYFSRSKSTNANEIEQPESIGIQTRMLRRKSISTSLFNATTIAEDQDCPKIKAKDNTERSSNNIKKNAKKSLKSTINKDNIPKNIVQRQLNNSEHIFETDLIDDLIDSQSSVDNSRRIESKISGHSIIDSEIFKTVNELFDFSCSIETDLIDDVDILSQKRESRQKSISNSGSFKLFDEDNTRKSIANIEQSNKREIPASPLQKIVKTPLNTSVPIPSLSVVGSEELNNSKSGVDNPVTDNGLETSKSVCDKEISEIFEEPQQVNEEPIKRGRGRPKSAVPKIKTPKTTKISVTTQLKKLKLRPGEKVTKHSIKKTSYRKIPQNRLEEALDMLQHEDHPIWVDHNVSCNAGIHRYWQPRNALMSDQNMKLKYARQFLLRRDWLNLSKVLCLSTIDTKQKTNYYPLLSKYATLCLAHTDKEQFNKFVQFLVGMDDASSSVLKKCTKIIQENEE